MKPNILPAQSHEAGDEQRGAGKQSDRKRNPRADEARRIFHLQLHMPDLRADAQPKYRHQQERKRDTDDHDEQPEAKKRRTERRSHICILMALPRNPTVRGSL